MERRVEAKEVGTMNKDAKRPSAKQLREELGVPKGHLEIYQAVCTLVELYRLYGYPYRSSKREQQLILKEVEKMVVQSEGIHWIKYMKYKTAAFFSAHTNQPIPAKPFESEDNPKFILGGTFGRWANEYLRKESQERRMSFLTSIQLAKKGMPRPDEDDLKEAILKFERELTTPNQDNEKVWNEIKLIPTFHKNWADEVERVHREYGTERKVVDRTGAVHKAYGPFNREARREILKRGPPIGTLLERTSMEAELRRTVREVLHGKHAKMTLDDRLKAFFPSTSSNYTNTRKEGGQVGVVLDESLELLKGLRTEGGPLKFVLNPIPEDEDSRQPALDRVLSDTLPDLQARFNLLWFRILKGARDEVSVVLPHALPESLKIRIITKGAPLNQLVCRNFQRKIFRALQRNSIFKIDGEVTEEILNRRLRSLPSGKKLFSGDFDSATDKLKTWVLDTLLNEACNILEISDTERKILSDGLAHSLIETTDGQQIMQTKGQLMGHVLSFVFLCLAVATVLRWSCEIDQQRQLSLEETPGVVNGDDNVAIFGPDGYDAWKAISGFMGLEESVGKTYFDDIFMNMNSRNYLVEQREPIRLKLTPFVHLGLLLGKKRSGGAGANDQDDPRSTIGSRARKLIELAPEHLREELMDQFVKNHRAMTDQFPTIPFYIPEWLGGFGLPSGPWGEPTVLDLKIARRILLNWRKTRPKTLATGVEWHLWELATESLPVPKYTTEEGWWTEEYQTAAGRAVINLLFDSRYSIEDLHQNKQKGNTVYKALRHNASIWSPSAGCAREPLEASRLQFEPLIPNFRVEKVRNGTLTSLVFDLD